MHLTNQRRDQWLPLETGDTMAGTVRVEWSGVTGLERQGSRADVRHLSNNMI